MLLKDYCAKMYAEHPGLEEQVKEVERLYGGSLEHPTLVIRALLDGMTPAEVAADDTIMDL